MVPSVLETKPHCFRWTQSWRNDRANLWGTSIQTDIVVILFNHQQRLCELRKEPFALCTSVIQLLLQWWGKDRAHFQTLAYFLVTLHLFLRKLFLLFETFSYFWSKKERDCPSVFSPQVIDMIIKNKLWNIPGIPKFIEENIARIDYPTSILRNQTLQTQVKLPVYSFCLIRGKHYFFFLYFCYMCTSINNI